MTNPENEMAPTSPVGATSEALTRDLNVAENDHSQATSPEDSVNQLGPFAAGAQAYADAGWHGIIPLRKAGEGKGKLPALPGMTGREGALTEPEQYLKAAGSRRFAGSNIGMRLPRGYYGLDVDAYDDKPGAVTLKALEEKYGPLPEGPYSTSRTDGVSRIRLFKVPVDIEFETVPGPGVEAIQFHHRHITAWPSVHPKTGATYRWDGCEGLVPRPDEVPDLPTAWVEGETAKNQGGRSAGDSMDVTSFEEEFTSNTKPKALDNVCARFEENAVKGMARHDAMLRACGAAARDAAKGWYPADVARERLETLWDKTVQGEGREAEFDALWGRAVGDVDVEAEQAKAARWTKSGTSGGELTDAFMADTVAEEVLKDRFIWTRGLGWLKWDERKWSTCDADMPLDAIRRYVIDQFEGAVSGLKDENAVVNLKDLDGWKDLLKANRLRAVTGLARPIVTVEDSDLDADPDLLNARNGVVDLRTGGLLPHDPARLMTKIAGADYVPGQTHPDLQKAMQALPQETLDWYQVRLGQAATGRMTPDDLMIISHGDGENGKSAIVNTVMNALGTYAVLLSDRVLLANPDAHPTELMDLRGARYAVLEETPEARRLDTQRLKKAVGTSKITARLIRQNDVTFDATHSMFVNTNFKPVVAETDHGTWRRLAILPFPYTFRKPGEELRGEFDRPGDPGLKDRMKDNASVNSAMLAWIVQGAVAHHKAGRVMPEQPHTVVMATLAWRMESDAILAFVNDHLEFDPESHVASQDMREVFKKWLSSQGMTEWSEKTFAARFGSHDSVRTRGVENRQARSRAGLSRPEETDGPFTSAGSRLTDLPQVYKRWAGVRFRTDQDSSGGGEEGVKGVKALPDSSPIRAVEMESGGALTPLTHTESNTPVAVSNPAVPAIAPVAAETEPDEFDLIWDEGPSPQPPASPAPPPPRLMTIAEAAAYPDKPELEYCPSTSGECVCPGPHRP